MPETACLHIRASETDPVRVVEIPGISARIGRASYCEVRLSEPELAEEECRLRRQGGAWQLVPGRRSSTVSIDGHAVETPCPLPFDVPFRVGEHWFTLQPARESNQEWGTYSTPLAAEGGTASSSVIEASRPRPVADGRNQRIPTTPLPEPPKEEDDHLSRWRVRHEQRASRLKTTQQERRWEERWKAAGERLKSRGATPRPSVSATPSLPSSPLDSRMESAATAARFESRERPRLRDLEPLSRVESQTPLAAPPPSPRPSTALIPPEAHAPLSTEPPPIPSLPIVKRQEPVPLPEREPPALPALPVTSLNVPLVRSELPPIPPRAIFPEVEPSRAAPVKATATEPAPVIEVAADESRTLTRLPESASSEETTPIKESPASEPGAAVAVIAPAVEPSVPTIDREERAWGNHDPFVTHTHAAEPRERSGALHDLDISTTVEDANGSSARIARPAARPRRPPLNQAPSAWDERASEPRWHPERDADRPSDRAFSKDQLESTPCREWPSARDIFATHAVRIERAATARPSVRRALAEPVPTVMCEPAQWTLSMRLGWPPLVAFWLVVGIAGLGLSWMWTRDARSTAFVAGLLTQAEADAKPLPEWVSPPGVSWWKTSAASLALWAAYFDRRSPVEPEQGDLAQTYLGAALHASPLLAQARYAEARDSRGGADAPAPSLGLSRDVVALAWSGHRWLKVGKKEAALDAYKAALAMAARAEPERLRPPGFIEDQQVRRYELPGEDLIGAVVRDMAEQSEWTYAEWSEALPDFAPAQLATARLLRELGSPEATKVLDAILARLETPAPQDVTVALHVAGQAEALALRARLEEAEERYRRAIDMMSVEAIRRSWWLNLADIALRQNDESKRQRALEAARGTDVNDDVARRAVDLLKYSGGRAEKPGFSR